MMTTMETMTLLNVNTAEYVRTKFDSKVFSIK